MGKLGIKSDGNGGLWVGKPTFAVVLAVAGSLGWGGADLLMGPAKVREDERLKKAVEQTAVDLKKHEDEAHQRFVDLERRSDATVNRIDARLTSFEARLDQALRAMVRTQSEG